MQAPLPPSGSASTLARDASQRLLLPSASSASLVQRATDEPRRASTIVAVPAATAAKQATTATDSDLETGTMDDAADGANDVQSTRHHDLAQQLEILRGKLARRNKVLEIVRRAYYQDVIVVKEELRHARSHSHALASPLLIHGTATHHPLAPPPSSSRSNASTASVLIAPAHSTSASHEDRLSSVPSIDLRDVLPLFAPAETVLQVHPCETCGGHLELVHGESKELQAARQEMARATKSEHQMKGLVHRLRTEAKEREDVHEALQQRAKALAKENAYTLEQLQASRKMERDQKTLISSLRAKLQLAQTTQEDLDHVMAEYKDTKQQLVRSNHDRDIFSASNNHLKEELAEISKTLHQTKVDKAQLESDYGAAYYKLQEELKKSKRLHEELQAERHALADKTRLSDELHVSLTAVKDELATTMQRAEQTKRRLEDQLAEEEKSNEELQEQNAEFRKINKKLVRDLEQLQRDPFGMASSTASETGASTNVSMMMMTGRPATGAVGAVDAPTDMKALIRRKLEDLQRQLDQALMREHDLLGQLARSREATLTTAAAAAFKPPPMRKKISRMPSTTVITRFVPPELLDKGGPGGATAESTSASSTAPNGASASGDGDGSGRPRSSGGSALAQSKIVEGDGLENDGMSEAEMKNFEAYHEQLHRLMVDIGDEKDKSQKQQKVISDLERKNQTLLDRLEESKMAIEALNGSVVALKARLNQDNAGAAEHLEDMVRQIEDGKRDQQYENERGVILLHFLRTISNYAYELCDNKALLMEFDLDRPPSDEVYDESDSMLSPELLQKKRELRKKVLMDRAMKKFSQQCHLRAEMVAVELKKLVDQVERLRVDLDQAEHQIDSDQLQIRTLEAEMSKLQLIVDVTKNNLARTDKALKTSTEELQESLTLLASQSEELKTLRASTESMKDDEKRLTAALFEKTRAWEREINMNDKCTQKISTLELQQRTIRTERDELATKLQAIEDLAEWKRQTNKEAGVMAAPEVIECEQQTDPWRPQGLILRQRNDPERMPQRYLGKTSVTIACDPLHETRGNSRERETSSSNQSPRGSLVSRPSSQQWAEVDDRMRDLLEFDVYPPAKAGGRQVKTSQVGTRPRNLSRLFLSSDGVSQKYISPAARASAEESGPRPSTTL